jgi:tripartite-type tricarboxylate transporter receptor subunit TctC
MSHDAISRKRRQFVLAGLGASALAALPRRALAQAGYPTRAITFVCPWPAGGTADSTMRALVGEAAKVLGQPMVVENRTGAAGMIGTAAMLSAKPDGYTIGQIPLSVARFSQLGTFKFDPLKDITYIARVNGQTFGIATRPDSPFKTIQEVVAAAKANPGKISYSSAGVVGATHVGMEEFAMKAGITLNHIPYKGGADALQALLGGHVDLLADSSSWAPMVEAGKLRLLAVWGEQRLARFPNAPTLRDAGWDVVVDAPNGIGAPKGLDLAVHARLRDAFRKAAHSEEFKKACDRIDSVVRYLDADDYRKYMEGVYRNETKLIDALKLREKLS